MSGKASGDGPTRRRNIRSIGDIKYNIQRSDSSVTLYSVPYFQASLFAAILEDTLLEMKILVECNAELSLTKTRVNMDRLRALKYEILQPQAIDELAGIDRRRLDTADHKINKLDADRKNIQKALREIYLNLSVERSYHALANHVKEIDDRIDYYNCLVQEEARNRISRRELWRQLRQRRNHIKSMFYDTNCITENLKTQVEDAALNAELRSRYVEKWQRARSEQNAQRAATLEAAPAAALHRHKRTTDAELRVHAEVEFLVTISINETLEKIEAWMAKYDKDIEAMDLEIQKTKTKHIEAVERKEALEETIEKHAELIKKWVEFKDEREKTRLRREEMHRAAAAVQAWWRGLLVRLQLGPYKPQKKKQASKGGKKK